MKKIIFMLMGALMLFFASCCNDTEVTATTDTIVVDTIMVDSTCIDTTIVE